MFLKKIYFFKKKSVEKVKIKISKKDLWKLILKNVKNSTKTLGISEFSRPLLFQFSNTFKFFQRKVNIQICINYKKVSKKVST